MLLAHSGHSAAAHRVETAVAADLATRGTGGPSGRSTVETGDALAARVG
jgi:isocitrate/isopropylmalate dehydrogenase